MSIEIRLSRDGSIACRIEELIRVASTSIDAALYRFNNPRLAEALATAARRGVRIRVVLDRNKHEETPSTGKLLAHGSLSLRILYGRQGADTKMHHKFAVFDGQTAITGSYNWTLESEEQNFENLIVLRDQESIALYQREFATLWAEAAPVE
ncbi:MAG: phospholipase D-like domain-containing protein [Terriglobia bacterium]|jgi:phosphatidylserine/phosphatidylglycerophosphate/cardiolipin synthase-like enzyme